MSQSSEPTDESPHLSQPAPAAASPRYLLVKAHVGLGDRLQALSHAIHYATKYGRVLCVDWTDAVWSDGTIGFDTFFDLCGLPTIPPAELYRAPVASVAPAGWGNQLDRRADPKFLYREPYVSTLPDEDQPAQVLVYGSTGDRTFHHANLCLLRVKRPWRDAIVAELRRYAECQTVVHLRGTDRVPADRHDAYLDKLAPALADVPADQPVLVVSDCQPLVERFRARFPRAVLRTPHLDRFDPARGSHLQAAVPKAEFNLQTLIDFFLLLHAPACVSDGESLFSNMARFLRGGHSADILGYDG